MKKREQIALLREQLQTARDDWAEQQRTVSGLQATVEQQTDTIDQLMRLLQEIVKAEDRLSRSQGHPMLSPALMERARQAIQPLVADAEARERARAAIRAAKEVKPS